METQCAEPDESCEYQCRCPNHMVEDATGKCVTKEECKCEGKDGTLYPPGFILLNDTACTEQ